MKFSSYNDAQKKVSELNHYISLVDTYTISNLEQWIIKNYALTNSIPRVIQNARQSKDMSLIENVTREKIISLLNSKPQDELHKIIIRGYKAKIRKPSKY